MEWATGRGYVFTKAGRENQARNVYGIDIQNAMIWCNAYSEYLNIAPHYTDVQRTVLRDANFHGNGDGERNAAIDFWDDAKKQKNNGYRLPSYWEAELVTANLGIADMKGHLIEPYIMGYSMTDAYGIGWSSAYPSNEFRIAQDR